MCLSLGSWSLNDIVGKVGKIDTTDVLDDLKSSDVFNINNYFPDVNGSCKIVNFTEYGYSLNSSLASDFGLYLYVFNPALINVDTSEGYNTVELNTLIEGNETSYYKYKMELIDESADKMFLKFKIKDEKININGNSFGLYDFARINQREYRVAGFEIKATNNVNPIDYDVGCAYKYSGYAKGMANNDVSTLNSTVEETETLKLDVHNDYYRTSSSSKGSCFKNDLFYCYFAVPKAIMDNYGYVSEIRAEWYKFDSKNIFVTTDSLSSKANLANTAPYRYSLGYGKADNADVLSYYNKNKYIVSDITADIDSKDVFIKNGVINNSYVNSSDHVVKDFTSDDKTDILSYDSNHSGFQKFIEYFGRWGNITDDTIKNLSRIENLTLNNTSTAYLNPETIGATNTFISDNSDSLTYIFRYDVADYFSSSANLFDAFNSSICADPYSNVGFVSSLSFIHNFDIIQLTFNKDGTFMVIPVVSNPTSVFPKIESPITDFFPNWLKSILFTIFGVVVLILIIWLISKLIKWFSKFVKWLKKKK